jgi:hypothetical protein
MLVMFGIQGKHNQPSNGQQRSVEYTLLLAVMMVGLVENSSVWFDQIKTYPGELLSGRTLISAKYWHVEGYSADSADNNELKRFIFLNYSFLLFARCVLMTCPEISIRAPQHSGIASGLPIRPASRSTKATLRPMHFSSQTKMKRNIISPIWWLEWTQRTPM